MSIEDQIYKPILDKLGITDKKLRKECRKYFVLADHRRVALGHADSCKYYACVQIACQENNVNFPRNLALKCAGASVETFQEAFGQVCGILGKKFTTTIEETCKLLEIPNCIELANDILNYFKLRFEASLPAAQRSKASFAGPGHIVASVYLASCHLKVQISEETLLNKTNISPESFKSTVKQVKALTLDLLNDKTTGAEPPKKKHRGPAAAQAKTTVDYRYEQLPAPRITADNPIDEALAEVVKKEEFIFIQKLKATSLLNTPDPDMDTASKEALRLEEEAELKRWKDKLLEKARKARIEAGPQPTIQTKINFKPAASSSLEEELQMYTSETNTPTKSKDILENISVDSEDSEKRFGELREEVSAKSVDSFDADDDESYEA